MFVRGVLGTCALAGSIVVSACGGTADVVSPSEVGGARRPGDTGNEASPPGDGTTPDRASCNAAGARWAIGERAGDALLERARIAAGARVARFLLPGQAITLEFSPTRLNLELNKRHVVVGVSCG